MDKDIWLSRLWNEWLMSPVKSRRNADAEVSGLLMGMRDRHGTFTTNRLHVARRLTGPGKVRLWPLTSYAESFTPGISMMTRPNHKSSVKFLLPPEILKVPTGKGTMWSWLKGLWGSTGGLYFPKSGYYLTMIVSDAETSRITRNILERTGLSWSVHRSEFTLRNHEDITTFLCKAGMTSGALDFEGRTLIRSARNRANLASNYDAANIARSVKAAREQMVLSERIMSSGKLDELPEKLREVVMIRMLNPEASLEEIGNKLSPMVSKSTVKYRWKKIECLLENQHE